MLGKPPQWKIRIKQVAKGVGASPETIRRRFKILSELGYMKRVQPRAESGRGFGEVIYYINRRPIFKYCKSTFEPTFVEKGPVNTGTSAYVVQQSVVQQNVVPQKFVHSNTDINNTYSSKAFLKKAASKQQASHASQVQQAASKLSKAREVLANQIEVSKQTVPSRLTAYAAAGIFKKKSGRERLDKMNAQMQAEILARRTPCQTT